VTLEIAILLRKVLDILYSESVYEIRILYNHHRLIPADKRTFSVELKTEKQTQYFEDEESILLHIEEVV